MKTLLAFAGLSMVLTSTLANAAGTLCNKTGPMPTPDCSGFVRTYIDPQTLGCDYPACATWTGKNGPSGTDGYTMTYCQGLPSAVVYNFETDGECKVISALESNTF